jgi:hypothetical protein
MQQAHFVNNVSVVPVEGLSRKELFDGIEADWNSRESIRAGQEATIARLPQLIPDFVDETAQPGDMQCPNIFHTTHYDIPLTNGRVSARVEILEDLGRYLLGSGLIVDSRDEDQREQIADLFNEKSGVVVRANYRWGGNEGKGVQLGRFQNKGDWGGSSGNDYAMAFRRALNVLCRGIDLSKEMVYVERDEKSKLSVPLSYYDGTTEIDALVRDISLEAVREADQPVGEFMAWMQENSAQVNTVGELVRLATHSYLAAQGHEQRADAGRVVTTLPTTVKRMGDQYLELAQVATAELQPPENNRMDYLIH